MRKINEKRIRLQTLQCFYFIIIVIYCFMYTENGRVRSKCDFIYIGVYFP